MTQIKALAYAVVESESVAAWQNYAETILGMSTEAVADGLYLKMDERRFRLLVVAGTQNRYLASAWEVDTAAEFAVAVAAIEAAGVVVTPLSTEQKAQRCVDLAVSFTDPSGNLHELVSGYNGGESSFVSPQGVQGFKTGVYGLGHTVLPTLNFDASLAFFTQVLGFGLSDVFNFQPGPDAPVMRIYFLHAGCGRHHSLALAEMPHPAGCVHLMVEVNSMTDVGLAHDRMAASGTKLMATLGEHENDRMTSFYMMTPGNFAVEYGYGGMIVDPTKHETTHTQRISIWGHDFSVGFK